MVRDNSEDKAERILSIYTKLTQGKVINKAQQGMALSYAVQTSWHRKLRKNGYMFWSMYRVGLRSPENVF